jgi:hypothetical protein
MPKHIMTISLQASAQPRPAAAVALTTCPGVRGQTLTTSREASRLS